MTRSVKSTEKELLLWEKRRDAKHSEVLPFLQSLCRLLIWWDEEEKQGTGGQRDRAGNGACEQTWRTHEKLPDFHTETGGRREGRKRSENGVKKWRRICQFEERKKCRSDPSSVFNCFYVYSRSLTTFSSFILLSAVLVPFRNLGILDNSICLEILNQFSLC